MSEELEHEENEGAEINHDAIMEALGGDESHHFDEEEEEEYYRKRQSDEDEDEEFLDTNIIDSEDSW